MMAAMAEAGEVGEGGVGAGVRGDALRLPFPDGAFDKVICAEVLEHLDDDSAAMAELARVLRPGGMLAVTRAALWTGAGQLGPLGALPQVRGRPRSASTAAASCSSGSRTPAWSWSPPITPTPSTAPTGGCGAWSGVENEDCFAVRSYHRLLVWDITAHTPAHPCPREAAQSLPRQEPGRLPEARASGDRPLSPVARRPFARRDDRLDPAVQSPRRHDPVVRRRSRGSVESRGGLHGAHRRRGSEDAERAYEWLRATQRPDGSWHTYYLADGRVEEPRLDTNVCAYMATGVWHHFLATRRRGFPRGVLAVGRARHRLRRQLAAARGRVDVVRRARRDTGPLWPADRLLLGLLQPALRPRVPPAGPRASGLGARRRPPASRHRPQSGRLRRQGRVRDGLVLPGAGRAPWINRRRRAHRRAVVRVRDRTAGASVASRTDRG